MVLYNLPTSIRQVLGGSLSSLHPIASIRLLPRFAGVTAAMYTMAVIPPSVAALAAIPPYIHSYSHGESAVRESRASPRLMQQLSTDLAVGNDDGLATLLVEQRQ